MSRLFPEIVGVELGRASFCNSSSDAFEPRWAQRPDRYPGGSRSFGEVALHRHEGFGWEFLLDIWIGQGTCRITEHRRDIDPPTPRAEVEDVPLGVQRHDFVHQLPQDPDPDVSLGG